MFDLSKILSLFSFKGKEISSSNDLDEELLQSKKIVFAYESNCDLNIDDAIYKVRYTFSKEKRKKLLSYGERFDIYVHVTCDSEAIDAEICNKIKGVARYYENAFKSGDKSLAFSYKNSVRLSKEGAPLCILYYRRAKREDSRPFDLYFVYKFITALSKEFEEVLERSEAEKQRKDLLLGQSRVSQKDFFGSQENEAPAYQETIRSEIENEVEEIKESQDSILDNVITTDSFADTDIVSANEKEKQEKEEEITDYFNFGNSQFKEDSDAGNVNVIEDDFENPNGNVVETGVYIEPEEETEGEDNEKEKEEKENNVEENKDDEEGEDDKGSYIEEEGFQAKGNSSDGEEGEEFKGINQEEQQEQEVRDEREGDVEENYSDKDEVENPVEEDRKVDEEEQNNKKDSQKIEGIVESAIKANSESVHKTISGLTSFIPADNNSIIEEEVLINPEISPDAIVENKGGKNQDFLDLDMEDEITAVQVENFNQENNSEGQADHQEIEKAEEIEVKEEKVESEEEQDSENDGIDGEKEESQGNKVEVEINDVEAFGKRTKKIMGRGRGK